MKGFPKFTNLVAAISLCLGVIWPAVVVAAPQVTYLEEIRGSLTSVGAMDVDPLGNLYVADKSGVVKFNSLGNQVGVSGHGTINRLGLAFNPVDNLVYVSVNDRVLILDQALSQVGTLGAPGSYVQAGPIDVLATTGEIFVADIGANQIKVFNYNDRTAPASVISTVVTGTSSVYGLAVDPVSEYAYVSYTQGAIQVVAFDRAGTQQLSIPSNGFGAKVVLSFKGLDFFPVSNQPGAASRGYVADYTSNRVAMLDMSATPGVAPTFSADILATSFGGHPTGPFDVAFDPTTSRLFVTNSSGVAVFGLDGYSTPTNHAPTAPVPQAPVGGSAVGAQPTLSFEAGTDLDGDALTYTVEVVGVNTVSGIGATSYQVTSGLQEDTCYEWRVKANDGAVDSPWSAKESFCVNANNVAPTAPVLQSLLDGSSVQGGALLVWQGGVDADPYDLVNFTLEFAADAQFSGGVLSAPAAAGPVALQSVSCYGGLVPGASYFWRVIASDSVGASTASINTGRFVFGGTRLAISANMPGAKIYLGGNHAYAGSYLGEAPVELMDVPAGVYTVVVERAGFEPFVATRQVAGGTNVDIAATLVPAYEPWRHAKKASGLATYSARRLVEVGGAGAAVAPLMVDFDSDGLLDLLVMEQTTGRLDFYKGLSIGDQCVFAEPQVVLAASVAGGSPAVADWNNDGRKDLLIGAADGSVVLVLNSGTEQAPVFSLPGTLIGVASGTLQVSGNAVPVVVDIDGDQDKDLIVGGATGEVMLYVNGNTDTAPALADGVLLLSVTGAVAPFVSDWNADGKKDLLLATDRMISVAYGDGVGFQAPVRLLAMDPYGRRFYPVGNGLRIFALDADGARGKDLVVGDNRGSIQLLASNGTSLVPAFYAALVDKVDQLAALTNAYGEPVVSEVASLRSAVVVQDMVTASTLAGGLVADLTPGTPEAAALSELQALLYQ